MSLTKTIKKTKVVQTRLDADLIDKANFILEEIGLTASDIFRVLLKQVVKTGEVPLILNSKKPYFNTEQSKQIDKSLDEIEKGQTYSFKNQKEMDKFLNNI